jgi:hypothetical protein
MIARMRHHDVYPIDVTIPGSSRGPRSATAPEGVVIHHVPHLHDDDVVVLPSGLRVTSVARTLVDLAEDLTKNELRAAFARAHHRGILNMEAVHASRTRVEWRPSLAVLDEVIAEFSD